jgi:aspartate/methionine/tyrosine aminotransferase
LVARCRSICPSSVRYPPIKGIPALREAIAAWIARRYPTLAGVIDPEKHILPLNGSREGLFSAIFPALARKPSVASPVVLIPESVLSGLWRRRGRLRR